MVRTLLLPMIVSLAAAQSSPCDLNGDAVVDVLDVQMAVAMQAGLRPCKANVVGLNVCNAIVVERVRAASLGGKCAQGKTVVLTWTPSPSANIAGYYVYRALRPRGPYTKLTGRPVSGATYTDATVEPGRTYYYVTTTVTTAKVESFYSNEATAAVPR